MLLKYIIPILPVVAIFLSFIVVSYRRRQSDEEVGGKCKKDLDKSIIDNSKFSFISA